MPATSVLANLVLHPVVLIDILWRNLFKFEIQLIFTELFCYLDGGDIWFAHSCPSVCLNIRLSVSPLQIVSAQ